MLDVYVWIGLTVLFTPLLFCCEIWRCCCAAGRRKAATATRDAGDVELGQRGDKDATAATAGTQDGAAAAAGGGSGAPRNMAVIAVCKVLGAVALGYLIMLVILAIYTVVYEQSLVFPAVTEAGCQSTSCGNTAYCCNYAEAKQIMDYTEVSFTTPSGNKINGWYMESNSSAPKPFVDLLYNHGSGWNIAVNYRLARYQFLLSLGVRMLTYDYPGYGRSTGTPSEASVYESGYAAWDYLLSRTGHPKNETIVLGRSMGGGVAVQLTTSGPNGQPATPPLGVILQSTFASLARTGGDGLPVGGWVVSATLKARFESVKKIPNLRSCLIDYHSTADEWIKYADGKELYDAATNVPAACKVWVESNTALHDDPLTDAQKVALTKWVNDRRQQLKQ